MLTSSKSSSTHFFHVSHNMPAINISVISIPLYELELFSRTSKLLYEQIIKFLTILFRPCLLFLLLLSCHYLKFFDCKFDISKTPVKGAEDT